MINFVRTGRVPRGAGRALGLAHSAQPHLLARAPVPSVATSPRHTKVDGVMSLNQRRRVPSVSLPSSTMRSPTAPPVRRRTARWTGVIQVISQRLALGVVEADRRSVLEPRLTVLVIGGRRADQGVLDRQAVQRPVEVPLAAELHARPIVPLDRSIEVPFADELAEQHQLGLSMRPTLRRCGAARLSTILRASLGVTPKVALKRAVRWLWWAKPSSTASRASAVSPAVTRCRAQASRRCSR